MGIPCLRASGIHASATSLRFPDLCSLAVGIFTIHELSCAEYFRFTKSDRTGVAFLDFRVGPWNQVDSSR